MRHPAAFINAIAEARNFGEAIEHLQLTWDELCETRNGRNEVIEEAAKVCDELQDKGVNVPFRELCAAAVRALKSNESA